MTTPDAPTERQQPRQRSAKGLFVADVAIERFFWRVDKTDPNGCWLWTGSREPKGYGRFWLNGQQFKAHRAAYELLVGPIPEGLVLDHLCRVRVCVNPAHLEPVTNRENILRGEGRTAVQARRTHCPKGHPYDEANTIVRQRHGRPTRQCRACARDRVRRPVRGGSRA